MLGAHEQAAKLDWNESPFGPLPGVLDALGDELANVSRYPIEAYDDFRADAARSLGVPPGLRRAGARHAGAHRHGRDDASAARATPSFSPPSPSTSTG